MKITTLEQQKKNKDRLNIYIDGEFYCGANVNTVARLGFYEGKEVQLGELANIDTEDEYQKCMNTALGLVSRRQQSELEFWQKLGKKYDKPTIGRVIDRLRVLGYANDSTFAEMWIRERSKSRGARLLRSELQQKGISKEIITEKLTEKPLDNTYDVALFQAKRKYKPSDTRDENYRRVMSYLTRRGFGYDISSKVFEDINKATD